MLKGHVIAIRGSYLCDNLVPAGFKVRMGPGPKFPVGKEIPVIWTIFPGFNGQTAPNRRAAMEEHAAGGRTRSPTGLLRSARDLHFNIPTF